MAAGDARATADEADHRLVDTQPGVHGRPVIDAFRRGLADIGFLEGRDVTVEYHTAEGHLEQLRRLPLIWYAERWR